MPGKPPVEHRGVTLDRVRGPGAAPQILLGIVTGRVLESVEPAEFRARMKKE